MNHYIVRHPNGYYYLLPMDDQREAVENKELGVALLSTIVPMWDGTDAEADPDLFEVVTFQEAKEIIDSKVFPPDQD